MNEDKTTSAAEKDATQEALTKAAVKQWTKRIKDAKKYFEKDFERMRENMEFMAGLQWAGQDTIESERYVANFCNREANQKVANLYAKDPQVEYKRRERLDFQLWDGSVEAMQSAHMMVAQGAMTGPTPQLMQAQALLADIAHGKAWQQLVKRIGDTLKITYNYECDTQQPSFKYQMKQLVRRTVATGVGYVRLSYCAEGETNLASSTTADSMAMREKRLKMLQELVDEGKIDDTDPRWMQIEELTDSLRHSVEAGDMTNYEERLDFDFPDATSIIVDPKCKSLKGFVGARWIAQQYILPLEEANAYFETQIEMGGELVRYEESGVEKPRTTGEGTKEDPQSRPLVCIWEVFDITTKDHFFICDGWKDYVQEPQPLDPSINRFWPIFALTFNDIECEPGGKVRIFPPSDIELLRHMQKEWNRSREELRKHRKANRPWYAALAGWLADPDVDKINDHESNELVQFKGIPPNSDLKTAIAKFDAAPIDQALYTMTPQTEDMGMVIGTNTAQQQQPQRHVAATSSVIQEQARIQGANSNIDDLDDLLSELALAGGEMMLRKFSLQTVKRIAGIGAVFPEQNREDFLNEIYLQSKAASSGRPNKAVDVANAQQLGPLMLQAGANPWPLIKYYASVLDANIDPAEFAPVMPPMQQPQSPQRPQAPRHPGAVGQHQGGLGQPVATQPSATAPMVHQ